MTRLRRFLLWWKQYICSHRWRPAIEHYRLQLPVRTVDGLRKEFQGSHSIDELRDFRWETRTVRVCGKCERIEQLSEAEFYAQFGRISNIGGA